MVKITNLTKSYKGFHVLNGLNMTLNKGDVYGFLGKNGCGKTTTMNILCDIIPKDGGDIQLGENGEKIKVGYLPETPSLFGYMNGYEYLDYIAACGCFAGDIKKRTQDVLQITGMVDGGKRRIKGYSRGMNQRLGIAAAIYHSPDLLIMDEPTSALDPEGRAEVMNIIHTLKQMGTTIILCTHILTDVERVANRIGIIYNGKMTIEDNITDVISRFTSHNIVVDAGNFSSQLVSELSASTGICSSVSINSDNGVLTLETADTAASMAQLMRLMSEKNIVPTRLEASKPTLEEIYIKAVNGNAF